MWNLAKMRQSEACRRFRDALEDVSGASELSAPQQAHLAACAECHATAEETFMSRELLGEIASPVATAGPWFAPRVMAAIAARESELLQSLEAWAAVPRFAARLTWASALALLVATTWLYEAPKFRQSSNQMTVESLFDSSQSSAFDDILPAMETAQ
jgi:hypothetical protein